MKLFKKIEKSFPILEKLFSEKEVIEFMDSDYRYLDRRHFALGLWIRKNILKEDDDLYRCFYKGGVVRKEDMSSLILKLFYIHLWSKRK